MRLIYLDQLLEYPIRFAHYDKEHGDIHFVYGVESVLEYAEHLPIVDAVPVRHGEWKQTEVVRKCFDIQGFKTWGIKYMCESCGFKTIAIEGHFTQYNFCPNCGARMDTERKEE